jgi:hypothetical protein
MAARANTDPMSATLCEGSGQPWEYIGGRVRPGPLCPRCDAGPAMLRVPEPERRGNETDRVPDHPNMVVWGGRVDVVRWRVTRAANQDKEE